MRKRLRGVHHLATLIVDRNNEIPANARKPLLAVSELCNGGESIEDDLTRGQDLTILGDREWTFESRFVGSCSEKARDLWVAIGNESQLGRVKVRAKTRDSHE